ncbi:hypothetical protein VTI74DRAFT_8791 [Chaetomium olivicolor]
MSPRISDVDFGRAGADCYRGLVLSGTPRERGMIYGRVFADKIKANVQRHLTRTDLPPWTVCSTLIKDVYLPTLIQSFGDLVDELIGMARGSGVRLEHLIFLNVRDDLAAIAHRLRRPSPDAPITEPQLAEESTSAFFSGRVTDDASPILAQSRVASKQIVDESLMVCLEMHPCPGDKSPSILMVVEAGMISGSGINSSGIAVTGNCLLSRADFVPALPGRSYLPVTLLERHVLKQANTVDAFTSTGEYDTHASKHVFITHWSGNHVSFEVAPGHCFQHFGEPKNRLRILVHTNHFQSFEHWLKRRDVGDAYHGTKSQTRRRLLKDLIADRHQASKISQDDVLAMFANHHGKPDCLCQHKKEGRDDMTVSFVMLDPLSSIVSVCKGPPCEGRMMRFKLHRVNSP